ncbi:cytochrome-c oxidase, cbb3-type subunit I, partial [Rhizobium leguminosarum]|nr:cytochrome-c oxidase, cbb3-type subunit I [Rhizobium leguminosarum]
LVYSFAETVAAMFPYYVLRAVGGTLYLAGGLVMAWNVFMTIRGHLRDEAAIPTTFAPQLQPAE